MKLLSERTQDSHGFSKFICERLFRLSNQAFAHFDLVLFFLVFDLKANARAVQIKSTSNMLLRARSAKTAQD
jgi:hypothetical protein